MKELTAQSQFVTHECGVLLPGTPSFWSHFALPFGSVSSVWSYLRVADVVAFLSAVLLHTFAAHYVDDFFSVEQTLFAESCFATFQAFHRLLGFRMRSRTCLTSITRLTGCGLGMAAFCELVGTSTGGGSGGPSSRLSSQWGARPHRQPWRRPRPPVGGGNLGPSPRQPAPRSRRLPEPA